MRIVLLGAATGLRSMAAPSQLSRRVRRDRSTAHAPGRWIGGPAVYRLLDWSPGQVPDEEIVERCWLQMLNETARCIEEGVIREPVDVDVGVVFGFGFPPFRGGILREADRLGIATVVERLDAYADRYGERLRPARLLREMAESGARFHAEP